MESWRVFLSFHIEELHPFAAFFVPFAIMIARCWEGIPFTESNCLGIVNPHMEGVLANLHIFAIVRNMIAFIKMCPFTHMNHLIIGITIIVRMTIVELKHVPEYLPASSCSK
ncbi:hypothetical protein D3C85_959330 [compost metagenome]